MTAAVRIGNVEVLPVLDTQIAGSLEFMFPQVSAEQWAPWRRDFAHYFNPQGNLLLNIGTFVVRSEGRTMLIDTGLGDKERENYPQGNLLANLSEAGVEPGDVDLVVNTHLHIDHVGWNTVADGDGGWVPAFPNARYLVQQTEWDYWTQPEIAAQNDCIGDSVLPLEGSGQLDLIDAQRSITDEITLVPSPGHTPGHVSVAIVSGGERALIIGDVAHHPVQLTETEWSVMFDLDKETAIKSRQAIVERIANDDAVLIGGHFPPPGIGRLIMLDGRRIFRGADTE